MLIKWIMVSVVLLGFFAASGSAENACQKDLVYAEIVTNQGTIEVELWADKAPKTVENFVQYIESGFYAGTVFHRVIDGFMIQGGGMTKDLSEKNTKQPVVNEATNGQKNKRGTLAMARTSDVHSATAQFFINLVDNSFLDHRDQSSSGYGYAVFGRVIDGMDVVDRIAKVQTGNKGYHQDVPTSPIVIEKVRIH